MIGNEKTLDENYNYKNEEVDNSLALYIKSEILVKNYEFI
jgi:hypothetical protein